MSKPRYQNLPDAKERTASWAVVRQMIREIKLLQKSLSLADIPWNHSEGLQQRLAKQSGDYICWLGHASYLIKLNDKHFLIDPFFSKRASPFQFAGPKRVVPAPLTVAQLPAIDYVLVTHNHYDHLDKKTIKQLNKAYQPLMIVPEGLGRTLKRWRVKRIYELGWNESVLCDEVAITALPAYHYSRRHLFDLNQSWWCSFALEFKQLKLFHSGDTGYGGYFKTIGEQFGYFDYAMIGVGAYRPSEIMKPVHLNPEEAIDLALDIKAKTLLPMHWGTIPLTSEPFAQPIARVRENTYVQQGALQVALQNIGEVLPLNV